MTMQVKRKVYIAGLTTLILFGIFTLNLYAQHDPSCRTRPIKVTIIDANSNPVNDAKLTITINRAGKVVDEDLGDNNVYRGQLETRYTYTLNVSCQGYQTYEGGIDLSGGCGIFEKPVTMIEE